MQLAEIIYKIFFQAKHRGLNTLNSDQDEILFTPNSRGTFDRSVDRNRLNMIAVREEAVFRREQDVQTREEDVRTREDFDFVKWSFWRKKNLC